MVVSAVSASRWRGWCFCFGVSALPAPLLRAGFRSVRCVFVTAGGRQAISKRHWSRCRASGRFFAGQRCAVPFCSQGGARRNGRRRNAKRKKTLALRSWYDWHAAERQHENVTINDIYKADGIQGFGYTSGGFTAWE